MKEHRKTISMQNITPSNVHEKCVRASEKIATDILMRDPSTAVDILMAFLYAACRARIQVAAGHSTANAIATVELTESILKESGVKLDFLGIASTPTQDSL